MRFFIIDPGCRTVASHHVALNLALQETLSARGISALSIYSKDAEPDVHEKLGGQAVLQTPFIYNRYEHPRFLFDELSQVNRLMEDELERYLTPQVSDGDVILFHTIAPSHLVGIAAWLKQYPEKKLRVRIIARFHPAHRLQEPRSSLMSAAWRYLLGVWAEIKQHDVRFFADNDWLARLYAQMGTVPFGVVPISIDFDLAKSAICPPPPETDPITFGFFGDLRQEKGAGILLPAMELHTQKFPHTRYVIQLTNHRVDELKISEKLRAQTKFVLESLLPRDYYALVSTVHAVLIPYQPREYTYRTSHIFIEALGLGRPVVTIGGTWMDYELSKVDPKPGTVTRDFDSTALAEAMDSLISDYATYRARAWTQAADWRDRHNMHKFLDMLL